MHTLKVIKDWGRRVTKSSYLVTVVYYLFDDLVRHIKFRLGIITTASGTIHKSFDTGASLQYIENCIHDYKLYSGVEHFHGLAAEVGPGDSCGVGLRMLADGCSHVDLVDRFYSVRDMTCQAAVYAALGERYPDLEPFIGDSDLGDEHTFKGIERYYGPDAAAERFFKSRTGYNFIVSRAVLEHLYDPIAALHAMANALSPGGFLLHKVDLRDHGMFSEHHHELKFLEIPDWLYPWLTQNSGRPNRVTMNRYREVLERPDINGQLLVTRLAGAGPIEPHMPFAEIPIELREMAVKYVRGIRHRFSWSMRAVSDEDLAVTGIFIVASKIEIECAE